MYLTCRLIPSPPTYICPSSGRGMYHTVECGGQETARQDQVWMSRDRDHFDFPNINIVTKNIASWFRPVRSLLFHFEIEVGKEKIICASSSTFRSCDLRVMSPARFHCAMLL
jgi:hypothetical protein